MVRELKFFQAIREAMDLCMASDPSVYVMGLGVPDPKGCFGTTLGLQEKYGVQRVMDMPASENAMTGVAIGSALVGMRPILTHQRMDFAILSLDQIVNQAANWHYMFGGQKKVPLVIRMIVGRGWGQGPQHSQSLQSWFAHIPGLKVVMPALPSDAKGLLIASILDDNPVIFFEHRWLHHVSGPVPEGFYQVPIGKAQVVREGGDLTIVSFSYMTLEAMRAAAILSEKGVQAEVMDLRTLRPLDENAILESVRKTGRLLVVDNGWKFMGFGAEILARISEKAFDSLKGPPRRIAQADCPVPTTPALANECYPRAIDIVEVAGEMLGRELLMDALSDSDRNLPKDIPHLTFSGPF